jgi:hypothetical protein
MFYIFLSADSDASLNNQFVYSQKLGTHIETVTSKTKGLRVATKTPEGYTFIFGGYLNGAPKIFSTTLYVFKDDRLIFINLYADNAANKFGGPQERNKWTYNFYQALTKNLEKNYGSFFSPEESPGANCEDYRFYEKCNDRYYLQGKKKGIGIYIDDSREVGLTYFDSKAVKDLTYGKFLREARRALVMTQYSESSDDVKKSQTERTSIADPNVAMTIKLD